MQQSVSTPMHYYTLIIFVLSIVATPLATADNLGSNISLGAGSDGSSKAFGSSYKNIRDGDPSTYWQPISSSDETISIKWSEKTDFNTIVIRELTNVVRSWQLVNHDTGEILISGDAIGSELTVDIGDVAMRKISLIIVSANGSPQIAEMEVYNATSDTNDDSDPDPDDEENSDTDDAPDVVDGDIVLSPTGSTTLQGAIDRIAAGNTIYLEAGTYRCSATLIIAEGNNGTADNFKKIAARGNGQPVLDFSAMAFDGSNRGIILAGNHWRIKGIKIQKAGDNGMLIAGHQNIIESCEFYANKDTGLQLSRYNSSYDDISQWPSDNIVQDCYSHSNYDTDDGEDADGFAAKLTCGEGNKFIGCVAEYNVDDGWDLYTKTSTGKIGSVYFEDCEASNNGITEAGKSTEDSDGNGFKLGGSKISVDHQLVECHAYDNKKHGFTANSNPGNITLINCDASGNGGNDFKDVENIPQ